MSEDALDLLDKLLQVDPWKRPSLEEAQRHHWFQKAGFGPPPDLGLDKGSPTAAAAGAMLPLGPAVALAELSRVGCQRAEGASGGIICANRHGHTPQQSGAALGHGAHPHAANGPVVAGTG